MSKRVSLFVIGMLLVGILPARAEVLRFICKDSGSFRIDPKAGTVEVISRDKTHHTVPLLGFNGETYSFPSSVPGRPNVWLDAKTGAAGCEDCLGGDVCRRVK